MRENVGVGELAVADSGVKGARKYNRIVPSVTEAIVAIKKLFTQSKQRTGILERKVIAGVGSRQIIDLTKEGVNVDSTWVHSIDDTQIGHAMKEHGNEAVENARGQIAISETDFEKIPDILSNYDNVSKSPNKNKQGNEVIIYQKTYSDGITYYVEEIRNGRNSLAFETMYKKKGSSDGVSITDSPSTSLTASDSSLSAGKVTDNSSTVQEVEEKFSRKKGDDVEEKFDSMSDAVQNSLKQEFGSAGTSLNQVARAFRIIGERGDWKEGTTNVDIGGGRFDKASEYLKDTYGVENLVFDPFNRDAESNRKIAERVRDNKVDTVTCNNVLNVIKEKESRANVILQAAKAIKEDGTAYFSVYEGNKSGEGKQSKDDCWQNNRPTKDYVSEVEEYFEDVALKNGVITAKKPKATDELSVWATDASYEDVVKFSRKKVDTKLAEEYDKKNGTEFVRFAKFLDNGRNLSDGERNYFVIGKTGKMLNQYGMKGDISIKTSTVNPNRHSKKGIEAGSADWFNVINSINSPLAITEVEGKYRLYLNTEVDGKKVCVLMEALKTGRNTEISNIKTLFPREISKIIDNEREHLLYPTAEKLKRIIEPSSQGHNRQASELSPVSADKVTDNSSTVQEVEEKFSRKRDEEYKAAVERGDVETYTRMLEEEAKAKGYSSDSEYQGKSAFNGSAPSAHEYYETPEESLKAWENEEYEGSWSVADEFVRGIKMGDLANRITAGDYARGNQFQRESIQALREAMAKVQKGNKNPTVKVYRSVPKGVKESSFRNGDWVTLSKSYAKDNAEIHAGMTYNGRDGMADWNGKGYNIIEMDVPIEDLWWDGNDINEFGYDNGKSHVYKNTKNGRKLFEPTYDDDGNLIPLSKRFNSEKEDIRYSRKRPLESATMSQEMRERALNYAHDELLKDVQYHENRVARIEQAIDNMRLMPPRPGMAATLMSMRDQLDKAYETLNQARENAETSLDDSPRSAVRDWSNGGLYTKSEMLIEKTEAQLRMADILGDIDGYTEKKMRQKDEYKNKINQFLVTLQKVCFSQSIKLYNN